MRYLWQKFTSPCWNTQCTILFQTSIYFLRSFPDCLTAPYLFIYSDIQSWKRLVRPFHHWRDEAQKLQRPDLEASKGYTATHKPAATWTGTMTTVVPITFPLEWVPTVCSWLLATLTVTEKWYKDFCLSFTSVIYIFLNRQISILLNWHQNECLKVNKGLQLQSGSLCLWNECLFTLSFVVPSDKSHFWTKDTNRDILDG